MSWWVYLEDEDGQPQRVKRHAEGGTYAVGGTDCAELNVTYNYGARFREALPELAEGPNVLARMLDGKRASETLPMLERAVAVLGVKRSQDYWESSPGNAGTALAVLRDWASEHPDAVWSVS
jgi:hypothetical protein